MTTASISETLAKIRQEVQAKADAPRVLRYNAQGFEIKDRVDSWGGTAERVHTPNNSYEQMLSRISYEDNFDPS